MWRDLQFKEWYQRGQEDDVLSKEDRLKEFERLKEEAGANL